MRTLIGVVGLVVLASVVVGEGRASAYEPPNIKDDNSQEMVPPTSDKAATPADRAKERVNAAKKLGNRVKDSTAARTHSAKGGKADTKADTKTNADAASKRPPDPKLKKGRFPLPKDLPTNTRFVLIDLHEEVSLGMAAFVKRVVRSLKTGDILVIDINTFGGRVDAAVQIADALKGVRAKGAFALAYLHPRAISAGALISYACDIIVVAPGATMGAATPISVEGGKAKGVGEKFVSYMRTEMGAIAISKGRTKDVAEAMVDSYVEVDGLIDRGKTLTLNGRQALDWYVASFEAKNLQEVIAGLGYTKTGRSYTTKQMKWSWAEKLAGWLSGSMISGLLMTIGMLGLMIGLYTGGNPIPLAVGGGCLLLFFFGHHVVNLAGIEELLLFGAGVALLLFEVFSPGHLFPGAIGLLMILGSLVMGLINLDTVPASVQWQQGWITAAMGTVAASILASTILMYAAFKLMPETNFGRKLVLSARIEARATDRVEADNQGVVGLEGTAVTDLRPSGKVKVGLKRYDAVARFGHISNGDSVRVTDVRGFSIVVAKVQDKEQA